MPPEKKTLQTDLLDEKINSIAEKIKIKRPQPQAEILKSIQQAKTEEVLKPQTKASESEGAVKRLRTYQSDVAEAVRTKQESVVSISIAEKKRADERGEDNSTSNSGVNKVVIAFISILLIGGGAFALYAILGNQNTDEPITVIPKPENLIGTNKETEVLVTNLQNTSALDVLKKEADQLGVSAGSLGNIHIVQNSGDKAQISPEQFLTLIGATPPGGLSRSLQDFMVGAYGRETGGEPFIIFKTNSFEFAFSGMLAWEQTLQSNFQSFFGKETGAFRDSYIRNRDVRTIKRGDGTVSLLYSFLDQNTFVIAGSEEAFITVLNQYNTSQVVR